jgi:hypothetical protein
VLNDEAERERLARTAGAERVGFGERLASVRPLLGAALIRTGRWLRGKPEVAVKVAPTTDLVRA